MLPQQEIIDHRVIQHKVSPHFPLYIVGGY